MADYRLLVFTEPAAGQDEAFNRWYDEVHLGDVLAVPGFVSARRYRAASVGGDPPRHRYLAAYEIESDDIGATLDDLMTRRRDGRLRMSDSLGDGMTILYEPIGERRTS